MNDTNPNPVSVRDVARVLFRHRRKMAMFFFGVVALTFVVIAIYPRSYISESKLFIRVGRESVTLDPTATTGQTILLQKTQVDEVNSALDVLSSREVQQRVVERVGAERIINDARHDEAAASDEAPRATRFREAVAAARGWFYTTLASLRIVDPGTEMDRAIRHLDRGMRVWAPKESTIITVRYIATSPQLAHDVVQATVDVYLEQHLRLNQSEESLAFFTEQAETLHGELAAAQSALRDAKNAFQIASIEGKRAIFEEQIKQVELQLLSAQRDLAYSEAKVVDLTRAIAGLEPELVIGRVGGIANEARDRMREKLYELEIEESRLRARYKDDHPLLMQVERQRKQAEQILAYQPEERTQTSEGLNPNERALELELLQTRANSEALQAQQEATRSQHAKLHESLQALNEQEMQLAELQRNVVLLEDKYRMHVEKLEQARVNDALGRDGIQNVKVAQPASLVAKPVWPNKQLFLAGGLLAAIGGALGLAFLAECLDRTFRTTQQVESQLGLPVLLSFPRRARRRAGLVNGEQAAGSDRVASGRVPRRPLGSYQALIRELLWSNGNGNGNGKRHAKTIGVVGCDSSKLRSRVAAEMAAQAAYAGAGPVLLIDADARRRRVAKRFHVDESPGWRDVLAGEAEAESCIHRPDGGLAVMAPGGSNGQKTAYAMRPEINVLGQLEEIKSEYGLIVVDLPRGDELQGPTVAPDWLDAMVLVVEAERTQVQAAQRMKATIERTGVPVSGVVFANHREHVPRWL